MTIKIRQGDRFQRTATWAIGGVGVDLTGYTVTCPVVMEASRVAVGTIDVTLSDQGTDPGEFTLTATSTSSWPTAPKLVFFVRFVSGDGYPTSSPDVPLNIIGASS